MLKRGSQNSLSGAQNKSFEEILVIKQASPPAKGVVHEHIRWDVDGHKDHEEENSYKFHLVG